MDIERECLKLELENELFISKKRKNKKEKTINQINTIKGRSLSGKLTDKLRAKKQKILLITAIKIKNLIEQLGNFLEKHEVNILLKGLNTYLRYVLYKSYIYMFYTIVDDGQKYLLTLTACTTSSFIRNWFQSAGILSLSISGIPLFVLFYRSILDQLIYNENYQQLKEGLYIILNKSKLPYQIQSSYVKKPDFINQMNYMFDVTDIDTKQLTEKYPIKPLLELRDVTMKQLVQNRMENELGLIPDPNSKQLKNIISERYKKNLLKEKRKIMLYSDFINHIKDETNHNNIIKDSIKQFYKIKIRD